ncbi:DEAD/DEAH box helicase [Burkholderia gladioli]|uniref:DEAD/DEAH box helicase n=1 Tax=Burkholderia gladioli TaxID=28095 RepID=UPI0016413FCA|nr:ATP-binding domain-containing protein [Burkholderia gladioli]
MSQKISGLPMPLQVYPREHSFRFDPSAREVLDYLRENQGDLGLEDGAVFCNFPLFREEGELLSVKLVVVSPTLGVILIGTESSQQTDQSVITSLLSSLESTFSQVFSRLVKYPRLRKGRTTLAVSVDAFLFVAEAQLDVSSFDDAVVVGFAALKARLQSLASADEVNDTVLKELYSVLDGSKALTKAAERNIEPYGAQSKVAQIARLEEEIRRFDREQRLSYMSDINGPQRVRGLAGSGKTVVLAMKAAITLVKEPDATIAFTFYTKSLYQHVKQLITRFYRLYDDRDPDWDRMLVLHAWGGAVVDGFYAHSARALGDKPLTLPEAKAFDPQQPFDFACKRLLNKGSATPLFDYVFVDEAQDFPPSFLRLALSLVRDERLVIAYDVFQTIFDVESPTAGSLFGTDERGEPAVAFDEDIVLHKCYRNPREILVAGHAIGFGIYGPRIVQMLESQDHWEDLGYQVTNGTLEGGQQVTIERPKENSPSSISDSNSIDSLIDVAVFNKFDDEINHVVTKIISDVKNDGIPPEDIVVICADDRNVKTYFHVLQSLLNEHEIGCNNLSEESFGLRDFQAKQKVTLSTIYKAKGNEAYVVFLIGIDALFDRPSAKKRNMIFTAMTRAKGWLRVSGLGEYARLFQNEITQAKRHLPNLQFTYPLQSEMIRIKRDLAEVSAEEVDDALGRLADDMSPEEYERMLLRRLKEVRSRKRIKKVQGQ